MAINNWRYVVTWWYMDPSWRIVEETQYVPWTTTSSPSSNMFSNAEAFWLQAKGYADMGDNAMATAYWDIANDLWRYSSFANTSIDTADSLLNFMRQNEAWLQWAAWQLYNQLTWDIQAQRNYIMDTFWPEGTLTQEVNKYYDDLGNYLSTEAWRQAANIAAQWVHSWASLWAIRAQQNEAYNEAFGRYVQAKEQEINAKQQIASNLINYMSTLRREYWDTTNQYIIDLYKRANDMYNSVAQSVATDIDQFNMLRAQGTWWSWSSNSYADIINALSSWWTTTQQGTSSVWWWITEPANQGASGNTAVVNQSTGTSTNQTTRRVPNYLWTAAMIMNPLAYGTVMLSNYLWNQAKNLMEGNNK